MTILVVPLTAAVLFIFGALLLLVTERKGRKAGHVFLGAVAICTVLGLVISMARSPDVGLGSLTRMKPRTMVE